MLSTGQRLPVLRLVAGPDRDPGNPNPGPMPLSSRRVWKLKQRHIEQKTDKPCGMKHDFYKGFSRLRIY